jgi:hypothetical protein
MPLILAGESPKCALLREQYAQAEVSSVDLTGVGFFVNFVIPAGAPRADPPNMAGGQVTVELEGIKHGLGCVLFVREGVIATLEGYTYGEPFPEHLVVVALRDDAPIVPEAAASPRS